jgi:hypothetical protein
MNHESEKMARSGKGGAVGSSGRSTSIRAYCSQCRHEHTFVRARHHHGIHFFLSVITCGIWLVAWVAICIGQVMRPWRCEHCGWHKPVFRNPSGRFRHIALAPDRESVAEGDLHRSHPHA